ncbi:vacuolar ATP synthase catalytic subunit, putative [Ichthyophthirius multifiliis]|uniref:Vacuolar ATP synthase catalytic subunit, putative n=1 Tax=Ichthyophthirius multifiliis TaxID=5932 RepID=G0QS20_ICHMU|nr:vacuolar ATP synthase catalytic subunit, putative [Ichthyophthirius multifiliis]EGR31989.1 vacuolar ATP synthase catalytic subunit, putative [Ichthyophthirius multifiliis]|eukprot:XP_004035475.1 vacuolar ATP synthase catalytic subunit, putative [Ichthyophthirius multifiliis]
MCPLYKTAGMMRCIVTYYDLARKAIIESSGETKLNWNYIQLETKSLFTQLTQMKFLSPKLSRQEIAQYVNKFVEDSNIAFRKMTDN